LKGSGFPPGAQVTLTWKPAIQQTVSTSADASGMLALDLVVFPHDQLGPVTLTASGTGFTSASTNYLVVPNSWEPAGPTFNL
jgi:hypothetical protein